MARYDLYRGASAPYGLRLPKNAAGGLKCPNPGARKEPLAGHHLLPSWNKDYTGRMSISTGQLADIGGACAFIGGCDSRYCQRCRYETERAA
jgi:hypothetical protein